MLEFLRLKANELHAKYLGAKAVVDASTGGVPKEMQAVVNNYYKQWKQLTIYLIGYSFVPLTH